MKANSYSVTHTRPNWKTLPNIPKVSKIEGQQFGQIHFFQLGFEIELGLKGGRLAAID